MATASRHPQKSNWCIHQRSGDRLLMKRWAARCVIATGTNRPRLEKTPRRKKICQPRRQNIWVGGFCNHTQ